MRMDFRVRRPEGNRPLERCRHRWKDNIKTYLKGSNERMICELEEKMRNKW